MTARPAVSPFDVANLTRLFGGWSECPHCEGTGKRYGRCWWCHGRGELTAYDRRWHDSEPCAACAQLEANRGPK